jgi:hypothetical protein
MFDDNSLLFYGSKAIVLNLQFLEQPHFCHIGSHLGLLAVRISFDLDYCGFTVFYYSVGIVYVVSTWWAEHDTRSSFW